MDAFPSCESGGKLQEKLTQVSGELDQPEKEQETAACSDPGHPGYPGNQRPTFAQERWKEEHSNKVTFSQSYKPVGFNSPDSCMKQLDFQTKRFDHWPSNQSLDPSEVAHHVQHLSTLEFVHAPDMPPPAVKPPLLHTITSSFLQQDSFMTGKSAEYPRLTQLKVKG
ncbi:hypothetical protein P7K49_006378 [Saguinus oedipus]|uniref:Prolactin receptor n=1 Tax=Saguinus oedipus TaxID=9490 RepID=A0ABQ9W292_SAGOE|nr:hypothetical protein P7K49_006378 [Saguinus oedipus]